VGGGTATPELCVSSRTTTDLLKKTCKSRGAKAFDFRSRPKCAIGPLNDSHTAANAASRSLARAFGTNQMTPRRLDKASQSSSRVCCRIGMLGWPVSSDANGEGVMRSLLMVLAVTMLVGGCAVTVPPEHWTKSGATQETFLKDYTTCRNESLADRFSFSKGDLILTCMEGRGYKRDSMGDLFVPEEVAKNGFLSPAPTANSGAATAAAGQDYSRAVADYRNCLTAHPSNQAACEGLRHIMDADAQVLSGSSSSPPSSNSPSAK
jgi:hypothetical protein